MTDNTPENAYRHMRKLAAIGTALSAEKDVDKILEMIVTEAMDFTRADGGTLYMADPERNVLRFEIVRNNTLNTRLGGRSGSIEWPPVPLEKDDEDNTSNVSAFSAITKQIVNIADVYEPGRFDFSGTREYDEQNGYRSKSMLVVPMMDHEDTVIGVLQLINAMDEDGSTAVSFTPQHQEIVESLASQAAVAINNARLIQNLTSLFDSLITSIATAIDEKSPFTGGHVRRVAELSMDIAHAINQRAEAVIGGKRLSDAELEELRIAAWLHDLGKVATPESLLDKANKLESITDRAELITLRYEILKLEATFKAAADALRCGERSLEGDRKEDLDKEIAELEEEKEFILSWNAPDRSPDDDAIRRLEKIAKTRETVTEEELENLCVRRGTLNEDERRTIENHATVTRKMLAQLPFPKALASVPTYAGSHHEKLDGSGYPEGLDADEIPLQTRILVVADIFEALTARRPYKKPMSLEKALSILDGMADERKLDRSVIQTAEMLGVFERYMKKEIERAEREEE
jgi:HD-GYP domain-containing protein (c-di-GMP phosphodiesterase class II)